MVGFLKYRIYILGGLTEENFDKVEPSEINNYKNYTKFMLRNTNDFPKKYMIGYKISTISGTKWMPIYNNYLGDIRMILNKEFHKKYKSYFKK